MKHSITRCLLLFTALIPLSHAEEAPANFKLEGTWKWAGSAIDDNNDRKADAKEWKLRDAAIEKEFKDIGMDVDNNQFTLEADGKGYAGKIKDPEDLLTWKKSDDGGVVISSVGEPPEKATTYTVTAKGELLQTKTQKITSLGIESTITTFELYRKP